MRLHVTLRSGEQRVVETRPDVSLKSALMDAGIEEINALSSCGGCCACATCHVYIDEDDIPRVPLMQPQEDDLLDMRDDRRGNSRLSCQVQLSGALDGLKVTIAPEW